MSQFSYQYINYKNINSNNRVFIPFDWTPVTDHLSSGEYVGSIMMEHNTANSVNFHQLTTADEVAFADQFNLNLRHLNKDAAFGLEMMHDASIVRSALGTKPGMWIDVKTAYDLGLIGLPEYSFENVLPYEFENNRTHSAAQLFHENIMQYRAKQIQNQRNVKVKNSNSGLYQNTDDYSRKNRAPSPYKMKRM